MGFFFFFGLSPPVQEAPMLHILQSNASLFWTDGIWLFEVGSEIWAIFRGTVPVCTRVLISNQRKSVPSFLNTALAFCCLG